MSKPPLKRSKTKPLPPEAVAEVRPGEKPRLSMGQKLKTVAKWSGLAALLVTALVLFRHFRLEQYLQRDQVQAWLEPLGPWAPLVFVLLCVATMLLVVVPFSLMCALAAVVFGTAWGTFWSVVGGTVSAAVVFLTARYLGRSFVQERLRHFKHWDALNQRLEKEGLYYLFLIRALCLFPFNLVNYVSAITSIKTRIFVISTAFGLIPGAFIYNFGTATLLDAQAPPKGVYLMIGLMALFVMLPLLYRRYRRYRTRLQQRLAIQQVFQSPAPPPAPAKNQ